MGKTAVALYATAAEAQQVLNDLVQAGFGRNAIHIMLGDQSTRHIREWFDDQTNGGTGLNGTNDDANATLIAAGVPRADAHNYAEALNRGNALVSVSTTDNRIDEAVAIMSRHEMLDLQERMRSWQGTIAQTTSGAPVKAAAGATGAANRTLKAGEEATVPVIEEEIHVGKREVEQGGVRVRAVVSETPVNETVNLREEHVSVERRPVDRAVSTADVNQIRDQTIEVRETAEQAVVQKQARVVEEVVVRKETDNRQQQVQDTVRRTDVEVEQLPAQKVQAWDRFSNDFQTDYKSRYAKTGKAFTAYEPAYRYGYDIAGRPDWRGRNWTQIEPDVRRDWEARGQGAWEDFKDAVRYAWQRVSGQA